MENLPSGPVRKLGVVLFCLALLATLLGAFHLVENWRGKRKWEAYKRQLTAHGAKVDLAAFIPPPIPEEQNFAATPFFAELFPKADWTNVNRRWPETFPPINATSSGKPNERKFTDLAAMRVQTSSIREIGPDERPKAARELLAALKTYEPALAELRAARSRPRSRYNIYYDLENPWGIHLPHLLVIKRVSQLLSVKACAELAAGNTEGAMEDVRLMARLSDSLKDEMFLINYFVRTVSFHLMLQPVWEGLALDLWSDAQLEELQRMMLRPNFVGELATPLELEQAAGIRTADILLKQRYKTEFVHALAYPESPRPSSIALKNAMFMLIPRGWYHMEQYEYVKLFQRFLFLGFDATNRVVYPSVINANAAQLDKEFHKGLKAVLSHRFLSALLMPAVVSTHTRAAQAQTAAHQAAIACALERYRRKHGKYPGELAQLAPELMAAVPHDVIGGKPMRYKSTKPVALYSVGWDEKDNGGTPGKVLWDEQGDWIWTYPQ
jgi:hypothetical protein